MEEVKPTSLDLVATELASQKERCELLEDFNLNIKDQQQLRVAAQRLATINATNKRCPDGWDIHAWEQLTIKSYKERMVIASALLAMEVDNIISDETDEPEVVETNKQINVTININADIEVKGNYKPNSRNSKKLVRDIIALLKNGKLKEIGVRKVPPGFYEPFGDKEVTEIRLDL